MEVGMGILGWPPREFWEATTFDLMAALDGWREAYGDKKTREQGDFTSDEMDEIMNFPASVAGKEASNGGRA